MVSIESEVLLTVGNILSTFRTRVVSLEKKVSDQGLEIDGLTRLVEDIAQQLKRQEKGESKTDLLIEISAMFALVLGNFAGLISRPQVRAALSPRDEKHFDELLSEGRKVLGLASRPS